MKKSSEPSSTSSEFEPSAYTITVRREMVEGELLFVATVAELPDVSAFENSFEKAYKVVIHAIRSLHAAAVTDGRPFPIPRRDEAEYSGRVTLRLPRSLHAKLGREAVAEGVSLNQWIVTLTASDYHPLRIMPMPIGWAAAQNVVHTAFEVYAASTSSASAGISPNLTLASATVQIECALYDTLEDSEISTRH